MTVSRELLFAEWHAHDARLELVEPTDEEVCTHARALANDYNEPTNRALLTHTQDFTAGDVVQQFAEMRARGGHPFLLLVNGSLVGDCDLRNLENRAAEYAIMVGPRASQAKGLGTRFSIMVLALAFERFGLERVYASARPENTGSLRMFEKVGYAIDATPAARRYTEEADDVSVSIDASAFKLAHSSAIARIRLGVREA